MLKGYLPTAEASLSSGDTSLLGPGLEPGVLDFRLKNPSGRGKGLGSAYEDQCSNLSGDLESILAGVSGEEGEEKEPWISPNLNPSSSSVKCLSFL